MRELFDVEPDSLERFLIRWYGPPDKEPADVGAELPRPLREWFEVTSRWSTPVIVQNRVEREPWIDNGKSVVWVENQGVWLWAIDPEGDDPPVFDRENEDGVPWQPTGVPLSTFLLHATVFEAIWGAAGASTSWVSTDRLAQILAPLRTLPMPDWRWPEQGHRLYAADGLLAFAGPNPGPGETAETTTWCEVVLAADRPDRLAYLTEIEGVDWDTPPQ